MAKGKKLLNLELNWSKAKSLQWAIACAKGHVKEGSETLKELTEIEEQLENFTGSASIVLHLQPINNCQHMFDAYHTVDEKGIIHPIAPGVPTVEGTHYGHCIFCNEWIDLTNVTIGDT